MGINKIVYGGVTKLDISNDTVTPSSLLEGYTAHDNTGAAIVGTVKADENYVISLTYNDETELYEPDKTHSEIQAAYNNGKRLVPYVNSVFVIASANDFVNKPGAIQYRYNVYDDDTSIERGDDIISGLDIHSYILKSSGEITENPKETYIKPYGTLSITENGTGIDVSTYENVNVDIPFSTIYTGTTDPSSSLGVNGDIYLKVVG